MPLRQLLILAALFGTCLATLGFAWASGSEVFLFLPGRRILRPPSHPGVIVGVLVVCVLLIYWLGEKGLYVFTLVAFGILLGSAVGFLAFGWTPSWTQHFLTAAMIVTCIYAWGQKEYFEE